MVTRTTIERMLGLLQGGQEPGETQPVPFGPGTPKEGLQELENFKKLLRQREDSAKQLGRIQHQIQEAILTLGKQLGRPLMGGPVTRDVPEAELLKRLDLLPRVDPSITSEFVETQKQKFKTLFRLRGELDLKVSRLTGELKPLEERVKPLLGREQELQEAEKILGEKALESGTEGTLEGVSEAQRLFEQQEKVRQGIKVAPQRPIFEEELSNLTAGLEDRILESLRGTPGAPGAVPVQEPAGPPAPSRPSEQKAPEGNELVPAQDFSDMRQTLEKLKAPNLLDEMTELARAVTGDKEIQSWGDFASRVGQAEEQLGQEIQQAYAEQTAQRKAELDNLVKNRSVFTIENMGFYFALAIAAGAGAALQYLLGRRAAIDEQIQQAQGRFQEAEGAEKIAGLEGKRAGMAAKNKIILGGLELARTIRQAQRELDSRTAVEIIKRAVKSEDTRLKSTLEASKFNLDVAKSVQSGYQALLEEIGRTQGRYVAAGMNSAAQALEEDRVQVLNTLKSIINQVNKLGVPGGPGE